MSERKPPEMMLEKWVAVALVAAGLAMVWVYAGPMVGLGVILMIWGNNLGNDIRRTLYDRALAAKMTAMIAAKKEAQ